MNLDINTIGFLSTAIATIGVLAVSVYGAVRCMLARRYLAAFGILLLVPIWLIAQFLVFVTFDKFVYLGIAGRENHLEYAVTPVLNLAGAGLVWYVVTEFVSKLRSSHSRETMRASQADASFGAWSWLSEPKKISGLIFILAGVAALSTFFFIAGVLFVIVGVSLLMDVRIWRS